ncbi:MAG: ABC transporter permease subunit [Planctomycetota bacterium]
MLRTVKGYVLYGLGLFIVLALMAAGAVYWWPSFSENVTKLKVFASPMPMLGDMLNQIEKGGVAAYLVGQHFFKAGNTVGVGGAILFAAGAIAGEAHRGTLEMWLARPVSRARLLTERFVGGLLVTVLPVFITSALVPWMLGWVGESMSFGDLMRCSAHCAALLGAIFSLTFLWSAGSSDPMRIIFVMLMFFVFQFAMYMVKTATDYSLFRAADIEVYMKVVLQDRLDWRYVGPMLATIVLSYLGALRLFARRVP